MGRIMIAGTGSGCGKTTITCAVLQALKNRGYHVTSFKCGPDYIDPMFHSRIIGAAARNLDQFFCDKDTLNTLLSENTGEIAVIEGVMGFFDGAGEKGSSMQVARDTKTPVVLVIDCKGMAQSIGAIMHGFLTYQAPNQVKGFFFNRLPESLVPMVKQLCHQMHTAYLGRFPYVREGAVESRHLGLVTAGEIKDLQKKMQILAEAAEQNLCMDKLLELAMQEERVEYRPVTVPTLAAPGQVRIGVARDEAFCFYYEDNLTLLKKLGCEICFFSPLRDKHLPQSLQGLILPGGYPELYGEQLAGNMSLKEDILKHLEEKMPTMAECGGFLYLQDSLEDAEGNSYKMVGYFRGKGFPVGKLTRFGYVRMTAGEDNLLCKKGEELTAHEFHYWDCTENGQDFLARKSTGNKEYTCGFANEWLYAGFPHFYLYGNRGAAERFVKACMAHTRQG